MRIAAVTVILLLGVIRMAGAAGELIPRTPVAPEPSTPFPVALELVP